MSIKKFKFTADIIFEAETIDQAMDKLSNHFHALAHDDPIYTLGQTGEMLIEPVKDMPIDRNNLILEIAENLDKLNSLYEDFTSSSTYNNCSIENLAVLEELLKSAINFMDKLCQKSQQ